MSLAKGRAIQAAAEVMTPKKLSQVKDKDEKRFMIEDAFHSLKNLARVQREVDDMKTNDPELFAAAKAKIDQAITDLAAAKTS